MASIIDYPQVTELKDDNVFLLDGPDGTKGMLAKDLKKAMSGGSPEPASVDIFSMIDSSGNSQIRRTIWRGENLGSTVTSEQHLQINNGTFKGLFLGDYWTINNINWRIVDFDYWLGTRGDVSGACVTHHLVIMPDTVIGTAVMNIGGYVNTNVYNFLQNEGLNIVSNAFGNYILEHDEYLSDEQTLNFCSTRGGWYATKLVIPNEPMILGGYANCYPVDDNNRGAVGRSSIDSTQLSGMRINRILIMADQNYWLRDIGGNQCYTAIGYYGNNFNALVNTNMGIRPVFGLTGTQSA